MPSDLKERVAPKFTPLVLGEKPPWLDQVPVVFVYQATIPVPEPIEMYGIDISITFVNYYFYLSILANAYFIVTNNLKGKLTESRRTNSHDTSISAEFDRSAKPTICIRRICRCEWVKQIPAGSCRFIQEDCSCYPSATT